MKMQTKYTQSFKIEDDLKTSYSTAKRGVQKLEIEHVIKQVNVSKRDKVYCATDILDVLEEPTKISVIYENF